MGKYLARMQIYASRSQIKFPYRCNSATIFICNMQK